MNQLTVANEAPRNTDIKTEFNKTPLSTYYNEIAEETKKKWQNEWEKCVKATTTKQYFPNVQDRLDMKIHTTPNLAARENQVLPPQIQDTRSCNVCLQKGDQTMDYLPYQCTLLDAQRDKLKKDIMYSGKENDLQANRSYIKTPEFIYKIY